MLTRRFAIAMLTLATLMAMPAYGLDRFEREIPDGPRGEPPIPRPPTTPPTSTPTPTTFEFRLPTGQPSPLFRSSSVTVPNDIVFGELAEGEAAFKALFEDAIRNASGVVSLGYLRYDLPVPTLTLSGEQTRIVAAISGFQSVSINGRFRPSKKIVRVLCGSSVRADLALTNASLEIAYDFFTGDPLEVDILYSRLDVDYDCNRPIIGEIVEFLNDIFEFADVDQLAIDALDDGIAAAGDALNGRFSNRFALEDVLDDVRESGPPEIRQAAEEAVRLLGGLRSAVAAFIADSVTEDLIDRLNLRTQAEIDALVERLDGLEEFIAAGLPGLGSLDILDLNAPTFDLSDYLDEELPYVQDFLYDRLNIYYAGIAAAIQDLEVRAIDALEDFVNTDFSRLFGGVNLRLRLYRADHKAVIDAFHDAPSPFIGRAEAVGPCFPTYTIPAVENATRYTLFNSLGNIYYSGTQAQHHTAGLLSSAIAENHFGLHSYPAPAELVLFNWGDVAGGRDGYRMPLCPIAGEPRPPRPPVTPPSPPPPGPGPGPQPPGDRCGGGTGIVCP